MSIMRIHKTKNFTVMSNHHFKEKRLSLKAKGLLSLMLSLPDDWNYSVSGLVKLSKDGKDSVMSALNELEKFGYLMRVQLTNSKGQFSGVEYHIFEEPQAENPISDNKNAENKKADNQHAENQIQLNTNKLTTENNKTIYNINNYIHILETVTDNQLRNLYCDFLDNRARMNDVLTVKGFELLIERVREIAGLDVEKQKDLVRTAVINNWKNVYAREQDQSNPVLEELRGYYD